MCFSSWPFLGSSVGRKLVSRIIFSESLAEAQKLRRNFITSLADPFASINNRTPDDHQTLGWLSPNPRSNPSINREAQEEPVRGRVLRIIGSCWCKIEINERISLQLQAPQSKRGEGDKKGRVGVSEVIYCQLLLLHHTCRGILSVALLEMGLCCLTIAN